MGILRVEVKRNTNGLLVREKAGSVTDVEVSYFFAAGQTCSRQPDHMLPTFVKSKHIDLNLDFSEHLSVYL